MVTPLSVNVNGHTLRRPLLRSQYTHMTIIKTRSGHLVPRFRRCILFYNVSTLCTLVLLEDYNISAALSQCFSCFVAGDQFFIAQKTEQLGFMPPDVICRSACRRWNGRFPFGPSVDCTTPTTSKCWRPHPSEKVDPVCHWKHCPEFIPSGDKMTPVRWTFVWNRWTWANWPDTVFLVCQWSYFVSREVGMFLSTQR